MKSTSNDPTKGSKNLGSDNLKGAKPGASKNPVNSPKASAQQPGKAPVSGKELQDKDHQHSYKTPTGSAGRSQSGSDNSRKGQNLD